MNKREEKLIFPEGFLWGAATSAHQVEGNNYNDWTEWEKENAKRLAQEAGKKWQKWQQEKFPEMFNPANYISGRAGDHYNSYEKDFDLAKSLGHNAHRFSIEWSRVEPEEGKFDEEAIEHYQKVILALRARGLEPFVGLWHFTNPVWIRDIGGWENRKTINYYVRYAEKIAKALPDIRYLTTFNEPNIYAGYGYIKGCQPPGKKNIFRAMRVVNNILAAHNKTYRALHLQNNNLQVGLVGSVVHFGGFLKYFANYFWNFYSFNKISNFCDFLGLNYYTRKQIRLISLKNKSNTTDLGWEIYPEGIYWVVKKISKYNLPIYITENGLADADDRRREKFIKDHLYWLSRAIKEGAVVKGYFYWSFLEIFEMVDMRGYWPKFGLVEIDYKTMERKIRPSAYEYAKICRENSLKI